METRAFVTRILFEGRRAVGVEYVRGRGSGRQVRAGEVILCGGAFNSPQLLQLSGVGPADLLGSLDIPVVADVPGVGEHLQDHLEVYIQYGSKLPVSMQPALQKWRRPWIGFQWLFLRRGPGATNHFEGGGFVRGDEQVGYPNLMFHFLPLAIRSDGSSPAGGHGYQVHVGPMYFDAAWLGARHQPAIRESIPRSASTTSRPSRTGASGWRPWGSPGTSSTSRPSDPSTPASSRRARP